MKSYFNNPKTAEELRKQYVELLKKFHPDNGGNEEDAKAINAEYEKLFERLKNIHAGEEKNEKAFDKDLDAELRDAINRIIRLDGIQIEICGSWVWVSGETFPVKEELKKAGYVFSRSKKSWYFHTGEYKRTGRKSYTMDHIRAVHGSVMVDSEKVLKLA